jgi:cell wall-associated NlpC family hydrolase
MELDPKLQKIEEMITVGQALLFTPYKWGGQNSHDGYDCSGFIQELLAVIGKDPKNDQDAQSLYNILSKNGEWEEGLCRGSILFFGKSVSEITHTAIALSKNSMLESGGGDKNTVSLVQALKIGAKIRIRPIRNDLLKALRLK